ncbi:LysM peptidoglycan-binding domain-containing protein [Neiella marina]|uniref:LysM peptidoglycan-binding domain-containing protein n=1 Tax=Neiella holothuriorum TaxID=2870530 RepID=A0ABS7EKP8_9GAMM|nr:LysM domain-containing protein [Neiella holothuriorum]MBW8192779.1 LysM peptidoglycan-binding domain-containing protein [Neiella holothuriorum]
MSKKCWPALLLALLLAPIALATELQVRDDYPEVYVVKKGDTLWDISELFLATPWLWPQLWQANPQVDNPHLIYPGDHLYLNFINGKPVLTKKKRIKLSPTVRNVPHDQAIPALPLADVRSYLKREQVVNQKQLEKLPTVLGTSDGNKRGYASQLWYAEGKLADARQYGIYRVLDPFRRPGTHEALGIRLALVGIAHASPAEGENMIALEIETSLQEIKQGDRLLPLYPAENFAAVFQPAFPEQEIEGNIIATHSGADYFVAHEIVVIDRGTEDGLAAGHLLNVIQTGKVIVDGDSSPVYLEDTSSYDKLEGAVINVGKTKLPDEIRGHLMVFRTFDKVSYAMIMVADRQLQRFDKVVSKN